MNVIQMYLIWPPWGKKVRKQSQRQMSQPSGCDSQSNARQTGCLTPTPSVESSTITRDNRWPVGVLYRYLATQRSEPPQLVPDIDDEPDEKEPGKEGVTQPRPAELELRLNNGREEFCSSKDAPPAPLRDVGPQPPIRRISGDARPLSAAEILAYRHLF